MHFTTGDDRLNDGSFIQITTNNKINKNDPKTDLICAHHLH